MAPSSIDAASSAFALYPVFYRTGRNWWVSSSTVQHEESRKTSSDNTRRMQQHQPTPLQREFRPPRPLTQGPRFGGGLSCSEGESSKAAKRMASRLTANSAGSNASGRVCRRPIRRPTRLARRVLRGTGQPGSAATRCSPTGRRSPRAGTLGDHRCIRAPLLPASVAVTSRPSPGGPSRHRSLRS
jgi:hypothetical protein